MVRTVLLSVHILAVIIWLGFGLYELLLLREIRRARGTPGEIALIRLYGRYAGIAAIATLIVAGAGVAMSLTLQWGFFKILWLGLKQAIMGAIILGMVFLTPLFVRTYAAIGAASEHDGVSLEAARKAIRAVEGHVLWMRLGGLIAVVLAVWRPTGGM